jgi:hypothetical protein
MTYFQNCTLNLYRIKLAGVFARVRSTLYAPLMQHKFYLTDGNIMYLTDASRFLISCVIQHYAPVVGWGGGGTDA